MEIIFKHNSGHMSTKAFAFISVAVDAKSWKINFAPVGGSNKWYDLNNSVGDNYDCFLR